MLCAQDYFLQAQHGTVCLLALVTVTDDRLHMYNGVEIVPKFSFSLLAFLFYAFPSFSFLNAFLI